MSARGYAHFQSDWAIGPTSRMAGRTHGHMWGVRPASFYLIAIASSLWKCAKPPYARLSGASAGDLDRSPRCDRQLSKPIHDLSILCWDLKALPTHHLPWAGFGLRQPHWLILNARFH